MRLVPKKINEKFPIEILSSIAILDRKYTMGLLGHRKLQCGKFRDKGMSNPAEKKNSSKTIAQIVKNSRAYIFIKSFASSASIWESSIQI
ncbi:hypothetical protein Tco_1029259 [Tanacetum coccineum]|uniref:Uncharacterized protein n=1 Tax=Tanacetum coccineum TaxID=301880 RepID=A0ABQ5G2X5_9ASTR